MSLGTPPFISLRPEDIKPFGRKRLDKAVQLPDLGPAAVVTGLQ